METASERLLVRVRVVTWVLIAGLILSGATAIPLRSEVRALVGVTGASKWEGNSSAPAWATWLLRAQDALERTAANDGFLFYGTDWLAFGHFAIALVFMGALRNPVRNRAVFVFGMRACLLLIPYALILGSVRGIPVWWRLADSLFGVFGFIPAWLCWRWTRAIERSERLGEPMNSTAAHAQVLPMT